MPQRASELLPSPSQIDPEFLAALPEDVRQEIEQAYKQKDSLVARSHIQAGRLGPAPENNTERTMITIQAEDVYRKKETSQVIAPPKQVPLFVAKRIPAASHKYS